MVSNVAATHSPILANISAGLYKVEMPLYGNDAEQPGGGDASFGMVIRSDLSTGDAYIESFTSGRDGQPSRAQAAGLLVHSIFVGVAGTNVRGAGQAGVIAALAAAFRRSVACADQSGSGMGKAGDDQTCHITDSDAPRAAVQVTSRSQLSQGSESDRDGGLVRAKIETWLATIPIGGQEHRTYDASAMTEFALQHQWIAELSAEEIYENFVEARLANVEAIERTRTEAELRRRMAAGVAERQQGLTIEFWMQLPTAPLQLNILPPGDDSQSARRHAGGRSVSNQDRTALLERATESLEVSKQVPMERLQLMLENHARDYAEAAWPAFGVGNAIDPGPGAGSSDSPDFFAGRSAGGTGSPRGEWQDTAAGAVVEMLGLRLEELLALFEPLDDQASHGQLARLPHDLIAEAAALEVAYERVDTLCAYVENVGVQLTAVEAEVAAAEAKLLSGSQHSPGAVLDALFGMGKSSAPALLSTGAPSAVVQSARKSTVKNDVALNKSQKEERSIEPIPAVCSPSGQPLVEFRVHDDGFSCDRCATAVAKGDIMYGNREDDYDLCVQCFASPERASSSGRAQPVSKSVLGIFGF